MKPAVPPTRQPPSRTAANANSGHVASDSNGTGHDDDVGFATSSIVRGVADLRLSPQRPSSSQQQQPQEQPQTPPSPRALLLKKMQNNDEEDWEKAWAEDSEDSDDDGDATPKRANNHNNVAVPAAMGVLPMPTVPCLDQGAPGGHIELSQQSPEVDGSARVVPVPTSTGISPAHLPFASASIPPEELPPDHLHDQQRFQQSDDVSSSFPGMLKTPIIQYPPIRPDSHFVSPEGRSTQRDIEEDERLMHEANEALQYDEVGEDGRRYDWNSFIREEVSPEDERPCVSMFDPALRVLGRGSFGRVSLSVLDHAMECFNDSSQSNFRLLRTNTPR